MFVNYCSDQTLGVAWNNLLVTDRAHVLREIALFETETLTGEELSLLAQQEDTDVISTLKKEHECVPLALFTDPTQVWQDLSHSERHLTLHELSTSVMKWYQYSRHF